MNLLKQWFSHKYSLILILAITLLSYILAALLPLLSVILIGFLLGVLSGNLYPFEASCQKDFSFAGSKLLEISVVFLAFSINFTNIKSLGLPMITTVVLTLIVVLILSILLSKWFKCPNTTAWLTGFGTAICGSSAIAAAAPLVSKDKNDAAIALAVVNLLGSIAMIALPFLLNLFPLSITFKGLLLGGSLHSVGNVAGAAYTMDKEIGDAAITIKMARVALLSPALLFFQYLTTQNNKIGIKQYLKLPFYLILFLIISIMVSLIAIPPSFTHLMENSGKFVLTLAMVAIGLNIQVRHLISSGRKAMLFGIVIFILQLLLLSTFGLILL